MAHFSVFAVSFFIFNLSFLPYERVFAAKAAPTATPVRNEKPSEAMFYKLRETVARGISVSTEQPIVFSWTFDAFWYARSSGFVSNRQSSL